MTAASPAYIPPFERGRSDAPRSHPDLAHSTGLVFACQQPVVNNQDDQRKRGSPLVLISLLCMDPMHGRPRRKSRAQAQSALQIGLPQRALRRAMH